MDSGKNMTQQFNSIHFHIDSRALCSDLVYVILFPQLLCVVHFPEWCNTYGSLFSYCLGMMIRLSGGESLIGLPPLVYFPGYVEPTEEEVCNVMIHSKKYDIGFQKNLI